ncbi:MAG: DUF2905 domain-containing protein [Candidatus Omnitrophota bacterium]
MSGIGRFIIMTGVSAALVGLALKGISHFRIPFPLGKLKGDIFFQRNSFTFYFPLTTSIIASIILTLLLCLFSKK